MTLLSKLTNKNIRLNKRRTIVTVIGITLSVALIMAVATMYASAIKSLINYETHVKGNFHVAFFNVQKNDVKKIENNRGVTDVFLVNQIGYAEIENENSDYTPYLCITGLTAEALHGLSVNLTEGRLPEKEGEVLIPTHLKTSGRVDVKIGEKIKLAVGMREADGKELTQRDNLDPSEKLVRTEEKEYTVVGIIERPASNVEPWSAPGYTVMTLQDADEMDGTVDVYARYTRRASSEHLRVTAGILGVDADAFEKYANYDYTTDEEESLAKEVEKAKYQYTTNGYLILLENNPLGDNSMRELGTLAAVMCVVIVITSVYCIKNSFDISITEKTKQYGMLRSIGATKKQIRSNVFYEATVLGLVGIPLGILLGLLASFVLVLVSNALLYGILDTSLKIVLEFSPIAVIVAILLGFVTIYFSALRSANKASKVSPIDSIRNSADIQIKAKNVKSPKIIKKIFGIGGDISYKNLKRNNKKYRTTVVSIILSVSVFIATSYFITAAFGEIKNEVKTYDYNLNLTVFAEKESELYNKAKSTLKLDNIKDSALAYNSYIEITDPKVNADFDSARGYESGDTETEFLTVWAYDDAKYESILKALNLSKDDCTGGVLMGLEKVDIVENGKSADKYFQKFDYKKGDTIEFYADGDFEREKQNLTVSAVTADDPTGSPRTILLVSEDTFAKMFPQNKMLQIVYMSDDATKLQDDIESVLHGEEYYLNNIEEQARLMNNLFTLISIFLYGFIVVITLIGVTNIFNTITTTMNLRRREFAMLKSIGMTGKEFSRMIRLETVFIGARSLIFGIPIGLVLSYGMHFAVEFSRGLPFKAPWLAILISIVAVYLLIAVLMRYSMSKIKRSNTIETIRNENI